MVPPICGALQVCRQLQKVFNLPAHMTQFTISVDLESNIAQIEATFLFDETMLKEDTDARERTIDGSEIMTAGETGIETTCAAAENDQFCQRSTQSGTMRTRA